MTFIADNQLLLLVQSCLTGLICTLFLFSKPAAHIS